MTGEGDKSDFDDPWNKLIRESEEREKLKKLIRENPWVRDIIKVLWPSKLGLSMKVLERELRERRKRKKLPISDEYGKTIQNCLNNHTSQSQSKSKCKEEDDLFYSPGGKGTGTWAVHRERAAAWLERKNLPQIEP